MKAKLVAGLVAIALGGFTSCGNILEENGVINNVAQNGTGELRINLVADGSLDVMTKATESITTSVSETDFTIYGTKNGTENSLGQYASAMKVAAGTYTQLRAVCDKMGSEPFAFDAPHFEGTTSGNTIVQTGTPATASIDAKLKNSVITVDLGNLSSLATITKLQLQLDNNENPSKILDLLENSSTLTTKQIFVKANQNNVYIHIEGKLKSEENKTFKYTQHIGDTADAATTAQKKYAVTYNLSSDNGTLGLTITINKNVEKVEIKVPDIDPYK